MEVVVLGQGIIGFVIKAVVNRNVSVAVAPQQGAAVDASDDRCVLARPVVNKVFDLPGYTAYQASNRQWQGCLKPQCNVVTRLAPQRRGIGFEAVHQARKSGGGRRRLGVRRNPRRFDTGARARRRRQEVDVLLSRFTLLQFNCVTLN